MKKSSLFIALCFSWTALAQNIGIKDFNNWQITDILKQGYEKERLFSDMNRDLIKIGDSICSNRAMVWVYDFKRFQNIDAAKIFMFYTKKKKGFGEITWWYHVAPVINENGKLVVMDAGFPGFIDEPMTVPEWIKIFSQSTNCKEIQANESELVKKMFDGMIFPPTTKYGTYDCYYKITPAGYWTPSSVAMGLLGLNDKDEPVHYNRDILDSEEVYNACVEAVTSKLGWAMGAGKTKCKKYLGL